MSKNRALLNPEILLWARTESHYSVKQVSGKTQISPEKIILWEKGQSYPTVNQLLKLAKIYQQSFATFYLSQPPTIKEPKIKDFRRVPETAFEYISPEINFEIKKSVNKREIALELINELNMETPNFNLVINLDDDPDIVSEKIRNYLDISFEEQINIIDYRVAFNFFREKVENSGVLIFQSKDIGLDYMRGFSLADRPLPLIVINRKDVFQARIFTIFHEICHIMLQLSSLCDQYGDDNSDPEIKRIERFCNSVAGATLVPTHFLLKEDVIRNKLSSKNWTDIDIELLAQKYKVSREVIVRRLLTLNLTDENFYNAKREQYNREYKDNIERQKKTEKLEKQKSFKKNIARNVISNSGKTYVKLVLSAYHSKKISIKDVLDYFGGIKLEQLSKIKQYIYG